MWTILKTLQNLKNMTSLVSSNLHYMKLWQLRTRFWSSQSVDKRKMPSLKSQEKSFKNNLAMIKSLWHQFLHLRRDHTKVTFFFSSFIGCIQEKMHLGVGTIFGSQSTNQRSRVNSTVDQAKPYLNLTNFLFLLKTSAGVRRIEKSKLNFSNPKRMENIKIWGKPFLQSRSSKSKMLN